MAEHKVRIKKDPNDASTCIVTLPPEKMILDDFVTFLFPGTNITNPRVVFKGGRSPFESATILIGEKRKLVVKGTFPYDVVWDEGRGTGDPIIVGP